MGRKKKGACLSFRCGEKLYRGGVEHDADGSAEGLGGEVVPELGADDAGVAVSAVDGAETLVLDLIPAGGGAV